MNFKRNIKKLKRKIHKWFTLGLEAEQISTYNALSDYYLSLADDNLSALKGYCKASYIILLVMMTVRCINRGISYLNTIPFLTAAVVFSLILHSMKRDTAQTARVRLSYILTASFNITWYSLAFFYDIFIQPDTPNIVSCLAFVLLASLFNAQPRDNIAGSLIAYIAMILLDMHYTTPDIWRSDVLNALVSMIMGICISQKITRTNISQKLYTDMYKTATKTSIIVAQIDIMHGTFEILQLPSYMSALTAHELTAKQGIDLISERFVLPEFRDEFMEIMNFDTMAAKLDKNNQINFYFLDFRNKWCQLVIVAQKFVNHKVSSVVAIVRDIDKERRKELEYQRQLSEAVEEAKLANSSKTNFLRRMSHDIRTPINGIRGMLEISSHYADDMEKQAECRKKMWDASGYLLALVNDVLDMNKLESGNVTLENVPFNLNSTLKEVNTVSELQAIDHGVSFEIGEDTHIEHPYLIGSSTHLKRVLQNLASNAIKYNRKNGSVNVSCTELSSDNEKAVFRFVCSDTGIGMSSEFQKKAFEPFAQEGRSSNTNYAGTGLGLSIVKELVERMGGTIELKSVIDMGSTFTITLPFKIDHAPVIETEREELHVDVSGKKALLVEDNDLNAEIASFILEEKGFILTRAVNGKDAVEKFSESESNEYDIIFMDIMMPVMNGLDATKTIRAMERADAQTIPIIAMSANAFHDDIESSLQAGMNGHLMKPLEQNKIDELINRVLASK